MCQILLMPFSPSGCFSWCLFLIVFSSGAKLFSCQLLHVLVSPCPQTSFFWYSCWFLLVCETSSPPWPKVGLSLFVFIFSSFLCQCRLVLEWVSPWSCASFSSSFTSLFLSLQEFLSIPVFPCPCYSFSSSSCRFLPVLRIFSCPHVDFSLSSFDQYPGFFLFCFLLAPVLL